MRYFSQDRYVKHSSSFCTSHIIEEKLLLKEIKSLELQSDKLSKKFSSLLSLHAKGVITSQQFKVQNQTLSDQQMALANRKIELQAQLEEKKDLDKNIQAFKKVVKSFLDLNMKDRKK